MTTSPPSVRPDAPPDPFFLRERTSRSGQNTKRNGRKTAGKPELAKKIQQARIGKAEMEKDAAKREAEQR